MSVRRLQQLYHEGDGSELLRGIGRFFYFNTPVRDLRRRLLIGDKSVLSCSVNGVAAQFRVTNRTEFDRFDTAYGLADLSEQPVIESLLSDVDPGMTFFDIGANVGLYSCLVGKSIRSGSVHAFEPHPANVSRLRENVSLNDITDLINVHDYALSDTSGEFDLAVQSSSTAAEGGHSLVLDSDIGETVTVSTYPGDELVNSDIPNPDIIKIDVEGGEYRVIKGLRKTIIEHSPIIYCELHIDQLKEDGVSAEIVIDEISELGYDIEDVYERTSSTRFIKATPKN